MENGGFWIDHGEFLFKFSSWLVLLAGVGYSIWKTGRDEGERKNQLEQLSKDVKKNCEAIKKLGTTFETNRNHFGNEITKIYEHFGNEISKIKESRFVKHEEHGVISRDCRESIFKSIKSITEQIDLRLKANQKNLEDVAQVQKKMDERREEHRSEDQNKLTKIKDDVAELKTLVARLEQLVKDAVKHGSL